MMFTFLFVFNIVLIHSLTNLPFSWDTVPTFAFPGAHDGFLSASEIKKYNLSAFDHFLIWGFNVSCQATNGTIYPADVKSKQSYYSCGPDNLFYPNLEESLSYQAQQIKANISTDATILAYIIFTSAQNSYVYQHEFNSPLHSDWWLTLQNAGTIDCYNASFGCEFQGPSQYQYDLRQTAVQQYFVNNIVMSITNSSYVSGIFFDEVDKWVINWCAAWKCTSEEKDELSTAIVETLELIFSSHQNKYGNAKVFSISMHSNMYGGSSDIYYKERAILEKYNDIAIRFYEDFQGGKNDNGMVGNFKTYLNETNYGEGGSFAIEIHVATKTMRPDWVELAAFLIGANNQSWFSYSCCYPSGWNVYSGWYQSEFGKKLGKPLTNGQCKNDWYIYNNSNAIYKGTNPKSNSTNGNIIYIGSYNNYQECLNAIKSSGNKYGPNGFHAFTWVNNEGADYALQCFGRLDDVWSTKYQNTTVSGHLDLAQCTRSFEYCNVMYNLMNNSATLNWK